MVNHARTLLLNATASDCANYSDVYIDPGFAPVTLTRDLLRVRAAFYPQGMALPQQIAVADRLSAICDAAELRPYLCRFDTRLLMAAPVTLTEFITSANDGVDARAIVARLNQLPLTGVASATLFRWDAYSKDMSDLFTLWTNSTEGVLRLGAAVLAYTYQVERIRKGAV